MLLLQFFPLLRLGGIDEVQHISRNKAERTVIFFSLAFAISAWNEILECPRGGMYCFCRACGRIRAVFKQGRFNAILKTSFRDFWTHPTSSRTSILPVTAAE